MATHPLLRKLEDPAAPEKSPALRVLDSVRAVYEVPKDDIASELLIPGMKAAHSVRIMVGFFSSRSFGQLAPGLAAFINGVNEPLQLLISPTLSAEDREAIGRALVDPESIALAAFNRLFDGAGVSESAIAAHVADCLAYLIAADRLRLRFVLMKHGIFHPKVWLFEADGDLLAVHGSNNLTEAGLVYNSEIVSVDRPWKDGAAAEARVASLAGVFQDYWSNRREHSVTVGPRAGLVLARRSDERPTTEDFWRAWYADWKKGLAPPLPERRVPTFWTQETLSPPQSLTIPLQLEWEHGPFAHQGAAVRAWEGNDRRGILAIATGGGKTTSALLAATRLQDQDDRPLLVLVLVPSDPLLDQWATETQRFGLRPHIPTQLSPSVRTAALHGLVTSLIHGVSRTEVIICSNKLYTSSEPLRAFFRDLPAPLKLLLIADEVHNLGTRGFLGASPDTIPHRLGLSATPIRQYDADGTAELLKFFGPVVFEFDIGRAIAAGCLTPYSYHLHEVRLTDEELDLWRRITEKLRKRGFGAEDDGQTGGLDPATQRLLERRRAILENACAKIDLLRALFIATPPESVARTLIYTSAKSDPLGRGRQITCVNRLLNDLGIISHQLTYSETGGAQARAILGDFSAGSYQSLTCMKVLDEGLDVPATSTAYLMASSTVRREWVQRRGRVLRKAPGKTLASLHDFFVVPPDPNEPAARAILRAELARADDFCRLAENAWDNNGPRALTERYS